MKEFPDTYSLGHYSRFQILILLSFGKEGCTQVCGKRAAWGPWIYGALLLKFKLVTTFKIKKISP